MKNALFVVLLACGISWAEQPAKGAAVVQEKASSGDTNTNTKQAQTQPQVAPAPFNAVIKNAPDEYSTKDDEKPPTDRARAVAEFKSFLATTNNFWIAVVMAGIAGVQAWFFWRQLERMRESNETAAKSAQAALAGSKAALEQTAHLKQAARAYVLSTHDEKMGLFDGRVWVTARIKNFGQTPAHKVRFSYCLNAFDFPYSGPFAEADFTKASSGSLGPGAVFEGTVELSGALNEKQIETIIQGNGAIYLWGYVSYEDVFGVEQETHMRSISTGENFRRLEMIVCEDGNKAT